MGLYLIVHKDFFDFSSMGGGIVKLQHRLGIVEQT